MVTMYRYGRADADQRNPYRRLTTRRPPGNVPYIVDNLWEWKRPPKFPNRRYSVFASPRPELAVQAGGALNGAVFTVDPTDVTLAQIPQADAREHPEVKRLARLIIKLLEQKWVDADMEVKKTESLLWVPCLSKEEVEQVFMSPRLSAFRDEIWNDIHFWSDARLLDPAGLWAYEEGEMFFEAESWRLVPLT